MCVTAGVAAVAILFILYGPVPVRRKVMIIPRMSAPDPFVDRPAASVVALPHFVPPGASMPPPTAMPPGSMSPAASHAPASSARSRARASSPQVAPLVLRRPGNPNPPPLSRARAARGTEPRPQPSLEEMHAIDTIDVMDDDQTAQVTLVHHDDTFLEDGR